MNPFRNLIVRQAAEDDLKGGGAAGGGGQGGSGAGGAAGGAAGAGAGGDGKGGDGKGGQGAGGAAGAGGAGAAGDGKGGAGAGAGAGAEVKWPDNWRTQLAGNDDKFAKTLERYSDPAAVAKALQAAHARISEGFKPEPFPDKGSDVDKAKWRASHEIPEKHGDYLAKVDGVVIGDEDKPVFESFAEFAHGLNMPQAQFNQVAKWYNGLAESRQAAMAEQDTQHATEIGDTLTTELGPAEYRANKNNLNAMITSHFGKETADALLNARGPDGRAIFNNAGVLKGMFALARLVNPISTLVGNSGAGGKSIDDRLAEINAVRQKDYNSFMKNDGMRKEERELIEAKQRLSAAEQR